MRQVVKWRGTLQRAPSPADFLALYLELEAWGGTYLLLTTEGRPFSPPHHLSWMTVTATTTAKTGQALGLVLATAALSPAPWLSALWILAPAARGAL